MRRMVMFLILLMGSTVAACSGATPPQAASPTADTRLLSGSAETLQPILEEAAAMLPGPAAGVAVAVIDSGETSVGIAGNPTFDENTLFEYGSITKVLTANVLAQLADEDVVALDDSVNQFLPAELQSEQWQPVTLANLSSHSAGLPRLPPNLNAMSMVLSGSLDNPYAAYDEAKLLEGLADIEPEAPGGAASYSNLGAGWLGTILSQATGVPYATLVEERLFAPLGMTAATIEGWSSDTIAPPLDDSGRPSTNWTFQALAGAGAARGNVLDAAAFLRASMDACAPDNPSPVARANCLTQQPTGHALGDNTAMGLGWLRTVGASETDVWHNGGTGGYHTFIGFNPTRDTGVVLLSNVAGLDDIDTLGLHYLLGE